MLGNGNMDPWHRSDGVKNSPVNGKIQIKKIVLPWTLLQVDWEYEHVEAKRDQNINFKEC